MPGFRTGQAKAAVHRFGGQGLTALEPDQAGARRQRRPRQACPGGTGLRAGGGGGRRCLIGKETGSETWRVEGIC